MSDRMTMILLIVLILITLGHFGYGVFIYLRSANQAVLSEEIKRTTQAVFHYMSVLIVMSLIYVLLTIFQVISYNRTMYVFLGLFYVLIALVNFYYALKPNVGISKMFQWIFFIIAGILFLII